ncbi:hypothetical protein [Pseudovibrio sp. Tun.PSC04-5.I4]|uniref:hypothetical protein n=1 Tax=Pseudovibrio sp. Tun.PSC04-5.I4 TaxID=1798213 RepID=UPI000883F702|nr:hypothetical protein [Pseudovibrio sp. Tun.PSC04-5.I4]SDR14834.1 hypothetical protein SAMN04515695_3019 [Pseudovibrio sp. Tun.PSC04-5.I4]
MTGVSFSSVSHLSSVITQIENASSKQSIKDNAQVRLGTPTESNGEAIYEAKTKGSDSAVSRASLAKLTHGKLFSSALNVHEKKLDNWSVFTSLAKNEVEFSLRLGGVENYQSKAQDVLHSAFEKIQDNPLFQEHDVRFGALKQLSSTLNGLVAQTLGEISPYDDVSGDNGTQSVGRYVDSEGAVVLPNALYGSSSSLSAGFDATDGRYSVLGDDFGVSNDGDYAEVQHGPRYEVGQSKASGANNTAALHSASKHVSGDEPYALVNKGAPKGTPVPHTSLNEQRGVAQVLQDTQQQVSEGGDAYGSLDFRSENRSEPGRARLNETYGTLDQSESNSTWGQKAGSVNNQSIYVNSGVESAVENSGDYSDVIVEEEQSIYGNITAEGKPVILPKPVLQERADTPPPVPTHQGARWENR